MRAAAGVFLIIGIGGRAISHHGEAAPPAELLHRVARVAAAVFAIIAPLARLTAVFLSGYALKMFIMSSIVAWLASVLSHI